MTPTATTEAIVMTSICPDMHLTELLLISPVVQPDGSVEGIAGSDADFCAECGEPGLEPLTCELKTVETTTPDLYHVTYA